jgi:hypothetical protein
MRSAWSIVVLPLLSLAACGDDPEPRDGDASGDAGPTDAPYVPAPAEDAGATDDPATRAPEPGFVTEVVSFTAGTCGGFQQDRLPGVVYGAPRGTGAGSGSLDVVSLGTGGEIVLGFGPLAIVDEPGADFVVFENAFFVGGRSDRPYAEPAEVAVSADGVTWRAFPCADADAGRTGCAGRTPVYSAPDNGVAPTDVPGAGGDAFDLADVGASVARFVRIRDVGSAACAGGSANGFDLDAVAIVHGAVP